MRNRRHSYATEMLRLGVSLPALMQLLGDKEIRMTLRYVQVKHNKTYNASSTSPARTPFNPTASRRCLSLNVSPMPTFPGYGRPRPQLLPPGDVLPSA